MVDFTRVIDGLYVKIRTVLMLLEEEEANLSIT